MTRSSRSISECVVDLVVGVAGELRRRGVRVSTSSIVESVEILESYCAVRGLDPCSLRFEDLAYVLSSTLVKDDEGVAELERVLRGIVSGSCRADAFEALRRDMSAAGARFGAGIRSPWSLEEEGRAAYARLRLLGLVVRGRRGWRMLSRRAALGRVAGLVRRYGSLEAALEEAVLRDVEGGARVSALLGREFPVQVLRRASLRGLTGLVEAALKAGEGWLARRAAARLRDRIAAGEKGFDADRVFRVLKRLGMIDDEVAARLVDEEPRLVSRLGFDSARLESLMSRARNPRAIGRIAGELERRGVRVGRLPLDVSGLGGRVGRALVYVLRGLETGNAGYIDMAFAELEKVSDDGGVAALARAAECLLERGGCVEELVDALLRLHARGLLSLGGLVSAVGGVARNSRLGALARRLVRIVVSRLLYRYYGGRVGGGCVFSGSRLPGARLDVRRSLRSMVAMRSCVVYRARRGRRRVVLLLDKSGSMREYAVVALLAAYAFSRVVRRLVVFDQDVRVFEGGSAASKVLEELLAAGVGFEGYTDVVSALREAARGLPASRLVLVSDLRQTVEAGVGVDEAVRRLYGRGWRVFVVAPPTVDPDVAKKVRGVARLVVVGSVEELAKGLARLLT